jgi:DNA-binding CsgD family transcriptional regulator
VAVRRPWRRLRGTGAGFAALVAMQAVCAAVFLYSAAVSVFGLRDQPFGWQTRELIELGAVLGLILGVVVGLIALRAAQRARHAAEVEARRVAVAFRDLMAQRFDEWGLSPAERDVALFAIKGLSTADIARLRATSEGTVKAQTAAIYRKAGVSGRPQLLSVFIENLMDIEVSDTAPGAATPAARPTAAAR